MDLLLMFLTILLWSHLASSQSWKRRSSISLQGGGDYGSDDTVKGKELDGSNENKYEYEYLSYETMLKETALNSLPDDDETKYTPKKQPTDIMSFTLDFYQQMRQFFVQMVKNLDDLMNKIEGEEDISKGNDRLQTKHEDKGHRLVPARSTPYAGCERPSTPYSRPPYKDIRETRPFPDREKDCTEPSEQDNCCTKDSPCKLGGGDCDRDPDCEGDLVCGVDNCYDDFYSGSRGSRADCCKIKYERNKCRNGQGMWDDGNCDCDQDEDCADNEFCGTDNCQAKNPSVSRYDCCRPSDCPESGLSPYSHCLLREGNPCQDHTDCKGSLLCSIYKAFYYGETTMWKCTKPDVKCIGMTGQDDCCTKESPCLLHGGHCLYDEDCGRNLMCGHRNCQDFNSTAQNDFNCCIEKDIVCGISTSKTVKVEAREWFSFSTQEGEVYKSNSNCLVDFELGSSCAELQFKCNELSINNEDREGCTEGDKLEITVTQLKRKHTTMYCQDKKPDVRSTGSINVTFKSSGKKMFRSSGKKMFRSSRKKNRKVSRKKNRKVSRKKNRAVSRKKKRKVSRKKNRKVSRKKNRKVSRKKKRKPSVKKNRKQSGKKNRKQSRKKNRKSNPKKNQKSDPKKNRTGAKCTVKCSVPATK